MKLKKILEEEVQKRYVLRLTVESLETKVQILAENQTFEKYKEEIFYIDGLEFELYQVKSRFTNYDNTPYLSKIRLELQYFCTSKLPKEKRERIENAKNYLKKHNFLPFHNFKVALWRELNYEIDIDDVLSGNINLRIE